MDNRIGIVRSVTINRPIGEVFAFWRDIENFPRFMEHIESVTRTGEGTSHWVARVLGGMKVEWDARITEVRENRSIGWRSLPESEVGIEGIVRFAEAPRGRGTEVKVEIAYRPAVGVAAARLLNGITSRQVKEDLRRVKQILEAGEIATTEGQPSGGEKKQAA